MNFLVPQKYFVVPDTGWSNWDLEIARGLCSRALVLVCAENHGGAKRLLRVRCAIRFSRFASFLLRSSAALTAFALILDWPLTAAAIGAAGLICSVAMVCQLVGFGRLMHRIVEAVAKQARLIPVEPVARSPLPIRAARTI
jgi:F0F1-type ATP synthase membrane subunit c/vacuolar-type H+-ATPase subunit K